MSQQLAMSHHDIYQLRRGWRLQWEAIQGCHVILYPEGMVKLSATAGAILEQVDGQQTIGDIIATLQQRYPGAETLADDVVQFIDEARSNGWLAMKEVHCG
ncbi:pyrroloquinoline quinone biosynthesis peptide chaperone PqqD [Halomonas qinghailakensis]|uniref:PqqA binding protein n=3 Tax=Halomonas TaxID=2745 RepID=A0AA46YP71_9GAMM|nr:MULTISPECIES: pyrroloquinoline quinone biosynthesis peptide chaperone PqqD [Halomonas]UYO73265.1 pyrroloquinoline quinone biosynthesis peptide chaperone PqqD [Halomonas sp. ZZQ-149]UYV20863.1 pyrroloquinoline quinone biosynthesis peptide chaperone PqqD [Halomonas qaidamensis]